jgi:Xaa-Pro aminopeptidase
MSQSLLLPPIPTPLERAREAMAEAGFDGVIAASPGLVAFLTGHVLPAHLAYPSRDGRLEKPTIAVASLTQAVTIGVDPKPTVGESVRYGDDRIGLADGPQRFRAVAEEVGSMNLAGGRLAVELAWVPAGALCALQELRPRASIEPLDGLLKTAKATKSDQEATAISDACSLADVAQAAIRHALAPGVTELELYAEAVRGIQEAAQGFAICGAEIQAGRRGELGMGAPEANVVRRGDLVMSDVYVRHPNGWWSDTCSTLACVELGETERRMWQELRDGLRAGQEMLRSNVSAGDVYAAIAQFAGEQPGHAGHSIGRDHFEEPVILAGSTDPLPEGAVVVLEPGRYGQGRGMRLEWAFRVTPDGGVPMTSFSLDPL